MRHSKQISRFCNRVVWSMHFSGLRNNSSKIWKITYRNRLGYIKIHNKVVLSKNQTSLPKGRCLKHVWCQDIIRFEALLLLWWPWPTSCASFIWFVGQMKFTQFKTVTKYPYSTKQLPVPTLPVHCRRLWSISITLYTYAISCISRLTW